MANAFTKRTGLSSALCIIALAVFCCAVDSASVDLEPITAAAGRFNLSDIIIAAAKDAVADVKNGIPYPPAAVARVSNAVGKAIEEPFKVLVYGNEISAFDVPGKSVAPFESFTYLPKYEVNGGFLLEVHGHWYKVVVFTEGVFDKCNDNHHGSKNWYFSGGCSGYAPGGGYEGWEPTPCDKASVDRLCYLTWAFPAESSNEAPAQAP